MVLLITFFVAILIILSLSKSPDETLNKNKKIEPDDANEQIKITIRDYRKFFKSKYNHLCISNIIMIYDTGKKEEKLDFIGYVVGYFLAIKDAASQALIASDDKENAEKISRLSFSNMFNYIIEYFQYADESNRHLPIFEVFKTFIPKISMSDEYDKNFYIMTNNELYRNFMEIENKFNKGILDGYIQSVKDWMFCYIPLDEDVILKIKKLNNTDIATECILSDVEFMVNNQYSNAHSTVVKTINDMIKT